MINTFMKTQYHIIYKTVHPNGKFYGGRHSTYDLDDGYLGSGLWVKQMKGSAVLTREIVAYAPDFETLVEMEERWIAENFDDPNCMNFSRSSNGWGAGSTNVMNDPEIAAKISGDNHWTKARPELLDRLSGDNHWMNKDREAKQKFVDNHPNKDGRNAKAAMENGTHINLTENNPSKQRSRNGTHQMLRREDGSSIGNDANSKRVESGTHNFLGPEANRSRVDAGTHNLLGSTQNELMLANGTHPSQQKQTCEYCQKTVSIGMHKRWHGDNCKHR